MANAKVFESAAEAHERDPRDHPYGYLTGGTGHLEEVRVFVWFRTLDELAESLLEVEPRAYGLEAGRGLEAYQARVRPLLQRLRQGGFREDLRRDLAPESDGRFAVHWWGTYEELRRGHGPLGGQLVDEFLGEERRGQLVQPDDEPAFVRFLMPGAASG